MPATSRGCARRRRRTNYLPRFRARSPPSRPSCATRQDTTSTATSRTLSCAACSGACRWRKPKASSDYIDLLRTDANEVQNLFNDLLIGVTQFFRDAREFEALEKQVIPKLFDGKGSRRSDPRLGARLRHRRGGLLDRHPAARAHGAGSTPRRRCRSSRPTSTAVRSPRRASAATWRRSPTMSRRSGSRAGSSRRATPTRSPRSCAKCASSRRTTSLRDAPFSRLDLISCRNLLIYLNTELQDRVIPLFHFALRPDGYLFLGNAENVTRHPKLFAPVERRYTHLPPPSRPARGCCPTSRSRSLRDRAAGSRGARASALRLASSV